jgi:multisubunit Na+/H+ antiporter MnhC subunit
MLISAAKITTTINYNSENVMNKIIGLAILVAGAILLYFGYTEYNSTASEVTEMVTGNPTDNAIWFLVGGAVAAIVGLGIILKK